MDNLIQVVSVHTKLTITSTSKLNIEYAFGLITWTFIVISNQEVIVSNATAFYAT